MTSTSLDDLLDQWETALEKVVAYVARVERELGATIPTRPPALDPESARVLFGITERTDITDDQRARAQRLLVRHRALTDPPR